MNGIVNQKIIEEDQSIRQYPAGCGFLSHVETDNTWLFYPHLSSFHPADFSLHFGPYVESMTNSMKSVAHYCDVI